MLRFVRNQNANLDQKVNIIQWEVLKTFCCVSFGRMYIESVTNGFYFLLLFRFGFALRTVLALPKSLFFS